MRSAKEAYKLQSVRIRRVQRLAASTEPNPALTEVTKQAKLKGAGCIRP